MRLLIVSMLDTHGLSMLFAAPNFALFFRKLTVPSTKQDDKSASGLLRQILLRDTRYEDKELLYRS